MRIPQELIEQANQTDLVSFLESQGEELRPEGKRYRWKRHDSVMISGNRWYWNSKHQGGYPIQFVEEFFGLSFRDAVDLLIGRGTVIHLDTTAAHKKKAFTLPEKDSNNSHIIQYLTGRGISMDVINLFINRGDLYQEAGRFHNVVFVGRDTAGTPRYCFKRGTQDYEYQGHVHKFRCEPEGSDKRFSFSYAGSNNKLCLFESCIDLMSFMTLFPESRNTHMLSLGGIADDALRQYMTDHPDINCIFSCLDADPAGKEAYIRLAQIVPESFKFARMTPTRYKDWNELLQHSGEVTELYDIEQRAI